MKHISIAKGLNFPIDVATQKTAFIGRSGSGKTYGASKLAEELLEANIQTIILDPVGIWNGLRTAADGKGKGFSIPIFGGEYGDIPLLPTSGILVANVIIEKGISAVLDVSYMRKGERKQFVTDFAEQFFHLKKKSRSAVHLIIEEAQVFIPQRTMHGEERMLGAMEDICKLGRNYGIGITLISQRPQSVHKDCLNQTEALFAFQINGPQERKVIEDWVIDKGLSKSTVAEDLSGLHVGTCFLWSPQWLRILEKIKILPKKTWDASRTPKIGDAIIKSRNLATIDLEKIKKDMESVILIKKENDPLELKRQILELKKELNKKQPIQKPIIDINIKTLQRECNTYKNKISQYENALNKTKLELEKIALNIFKGISVNVSTENTKHIINIPKGTDQIKTLVDTATTKFNIIPKSDNGTLSKSEKNILISLAQRGKPSSKNQIAILSGYAVTSGSFNNSLSKLRTGQYINRSGNSITITENGMNIIGNDFSPLPQGEQLHAYWYNQLSTSEARILKVLIENSPVSLTKQAISESCGYALTSGSFNNSLSKLRTLELIEGYGEIKASDSLFEYA